MSSFQIGTLIVAAVLLFWGIGAYNRLVGLRNAIVQSFDPVDLHLLERHTLLQQQTETAAAVLIQAGERLDALRAACLQTETARAHARARPGAPGAIKSLRLADDILAEARARLPLPAAAGIDLSALNAQLAASEVALEFAQRQFNAAVLAYNHALGQMPTRLIATVFGFAPAATL